MIKDQIAIIVIVKITVRNKCQVRVIILKKSDVRVPLYDFIKYIRVTVTQSLVDTLSSDRRPSDYGVRF